MINIGFFIRALQDAQRHQRLDVTRTWRRIGHRIGAGLPETGAATPDAALLFLIQELLDNHHGVFSDRACPECQASSLCLEANGIEIETCLACGGFWFDHRELSTLIGSPVDVPGGHLAHRDSRFDCPVCEVPMREYQFTPVANLLIDRCPRCRGVYLENQELERALALVKANRASHHDHQ